MIVFFSDMLMLYPSSRPSSCIVFYICYYKHGYKYQKLCHNPSPLPQGREGSLAAKSPNLSAKGVIWLNRTHSFLNLQAKFSNYVLWQNLKRIKQNSLNSPTYSANYAKFTPIINPFILLCFRYLPRQRTL